VLNVVSTFQLIPISVEHLGPGLQHVPSFGLRLNLKIGTGPLGDQHFGQQYKAGSGIFPQKISPRNLPCLLSCIKMKNWLTSLQSTALQVTAPWY